jgi:hypothetical protein
MALLSLSTPPSLKLRLGDSSPRLRGSRNDREGKAFLAIVLFQKKLYNLTMSNNIIKESKVEGLPQEPIKEITKEARPTPVEHLPERPEKTIEDLTLASKGKEGKVQQVTPSGQSVQAVGESRKQWPYYLEVEKILEENLEAAYSKLSPIKQQEFKIKGEETARKITQMLNSVKVKLKEIFHLIINWLKIIPGINKFFLEQEAKIKADKILALRKK